MPRFRTSGRFHSVLLLAALPVWMAATSSECPFLFFSDLTATYDEFVNICAICSPTAVVKEFEDPASPEEDVVLTFEITSVEPLEPQDVTVEMRLTCGGGVGGSQTFPVTLRSAGLTKLTGEFEGNARSLCVGASGQRAPALWSVYVRRNIADQSVTFAWSVSYQKYVG